MKQTDFTNGKILGPLLKFCGPIYLSLFLQATYGAVDLLVVGRFDTAAGVSAVATGSLIMHGVTAILYGLTVGCTVHLGQRIGAGDKEGAARTVGASIWFFLAVGVFFSVLMALFSRPLAVFMQAPEEAFGLTVVYVTVCALGTIFIVAYNTTCSLLRGMGESRLPLLFVLIACLFNIGGDLLLVAVFHLGALGAAIATVSAQALSAAVALLVLKKRGLPFPFYRRHVRPFRAETRRILRFGVPIAFQELLTNISFMVILAIFNSLGLVCSAGAGIAEKLCHFIMLVPLAFMSGVSTVVAHNIGAGKPDRARRTLLYAIGASLACGVVMFFCTFFRGDLLAGLFDKDPEIIAAAAD
ncbi:MAG: MATE family efflux transporter, partial [Oscillospiraceae bacterium]|nr:MATE family efflux transporter [Oscillospiraceae bacterium]